MFPASLVIVVGLLGQSAPEIDPNSLVSRLGAARYADREQAARDLEKLGREAIPALQAAKSSPDLEIRTRAERLIRKLESDLLVGPTMVALDMTDLPIGEAVKLLSERSGMQVVLSPPNLPRWKTDRVTLLEEQSVPFWTAIDRLCTAAELQSAVENRGGTSRGTPVVLITDRMARPLQPTFDHGPFRVSLTGLEYQKHIGFAIAPGSSRTQVNAGGNGKPVPDTDRAKPAPATVAPRPVTSSQCSVQFQVVAEPRLSFAQMGPPRLLEARDDLGNSLVFENSAAPDNVMLRTANYSATSAASILQVRAALQRPENPGATIRVLRGVIPLRLTSRQPEPLVVPLNSSIGKSFENDDVAITIHEIRNDPNSRQRQIELTIQPRSSDVIPRNDPMEDLNQLPRVDRNQQNLEIVAADGQPILWFQTGADLESSRMTLTLAGPRAGDPKELKYYRLTQTIVEVPFCFEDLPMP